MSGAHVVMEESDDTGADGVSITHVRVNGVDMGLMARPPRVRVGINGAHTTVALTLVVSRLEVRGELADGDRRAPTAGFTADLPRKES